MLDDVIKLVQQVGFPITVALYLLIRYDNRMGAMTEVLNKMAVNMEAITQIFRDIQEDGHK